MKKQCVTFALACVFLFVFGCGQDEFCETPFVWYVDFDGDGFGSPLHQSVASCSQPLGYTDNNLDCADHDPNAFPGQQEFFDIPIKGITTGDLDYDYNCDGEVEPALNYAALTCRGKPKESCTMIGCIGRCWLDRQADCGESWITIYSCAYYGSKCQGAGAKNETQICR